MAGKPKGDKRARTRAALINAAAAVIAEKGHERMSLEEVAGRAGMTRGAIYGNFKDKDELILGVMRSRWRPISVLPKEGATFAEQMRLSGEALAAAMADRTGRAKQALSFQLYAADHPEIRRRFAELNADIYRRMAEFLAARFAGQLPMPADRLVRALHALSDGLVYARAMNPKEFGDDVIVAAFEAFANLPVKKQR
jgi:AcrR family transcriptional regulator